MKDHDPYLPQKISGHDGRSAAKRKGTERQREESKDIDKFRGGFGVG